MRARSTRAVMWSVVAAAVLGVQTPSFAQAPVVASADPESLFTSRDPKLNTNKQAAMHIMRDLLEARLKTRAEHVDIVIECFCRIEKFLIRHHQSGSSIVSKTHTQQCFCRALLRFKACGNRIDHLAPFNQRELIRSLKRAAIGVDEF